MGKEISGIYGYYDNLKDKIVYVGQSKNIYDRHIQHLKPSTYNEQQINRVLQNNSNRYDLIILKECEISKLNYWEMTLIALFNPLFNFNSGGCGNRGFKHSTATKEKLRKASSGRKVSLETRRKISKANKGHVGYYRHHTMSNETREKISRANMGHPVSLKTRLAVSKAHKGKPLSEEHKRKISESEKGRKLSPEHIAKMKERVYPTGKNSPHFKHYARVRLGGKKYVERYKQKMQYYELVYEGITIKSSYKKGMLDKLCDDFNRNNGAETFDPTSKIWGNTTLDKYMTKRSDNNEENFTLQERHGKYSNTGL